MKILRLVIVLLITLLFLCSCSEKSTGIQTSDTSGFLEIYNSSDALMEVTFLDNPNHPAYLNPNSVKRIEFGIFNSPGGSEGRTIEYTCLVLGTYPIFNHYTDIIYTNQTTVRRLSLDRAFLYLYNNTNGLITLNWADSVSTVEANNSKSFVFNFFATGEKNGSVSVTYRCSGDFLNSTAFGDEIIPNQTTYRILEADSGCIIFHNRSYADIVVTSPEQSSPITIPRQSTLTQSFILQDPTKSIAVSISGRCAEGWSGNIIVQKNEETEHTIQPATGIKVSNTSSHIITKVYIKPHVNSSWGESNLSQSIAPNQFAFWHVSSANWDVKVEDVTGHSQAYLCGLIQPNVTVELTYDGY